MRIYANCTIFMLLVVFFTQYNVNGQCSTPSLSLRSSAPFPNTGGVANDTVSADFNGDGEFDFATTQNNTFLVFISNGNGAFNGSSLFTTGTSLGGIATGDFNRDGRADLVAVDLFQNVILVILGNGNGLFGTPQAFPTGSQPSNVAVGDFTSDGVEDLAVIRSNGTTISLFTGTGTGTFNAFTTTSVGPTSFGGGGIKMADMNRDGDLDIVAASGVSGTGAGQISVLIGNGAGTFSATTFLSGSTNRSNNLDVGDLNRDGRMDVVTTTTSSPFTLTTFLGNGAGGFSNQAVISIPNRAFDMEIGDINSDGRADVVLSSDFQQRGVMVLTGNGSGTSFTQTPIDAPDFSRSVVLLDANVDGKTDILYVGNDTVDNLRVESVLNSCGGLTSRPAGDFDGDGVTDSTIFRPATGTWFTLFSANNTFTQENFGLNGDIPVEGDFDGDGKADRCIFRPSSGVWFFKRSSNNTTLGAQFGSPGDKPVPGDYDKDGITDIAIWRPSNGNYFVLRSSSNFSTFFAHPFGQNGDIPVQGGAQ